MVKLDQRFDEIIKREVEKLINRGEEEREPKLSTNQCSWCIPSHMIVFLEPSIQEIEKIKLKLVPWPEFKKQIYEIIDHRIEFAPEINGAINNTYMTLDEHLTIFIAGDKNLKTRSQIEKKLMEFLMSLKYYS